MRWITSLRSLFFNQQSIQPSIIRSFSKPIQPEYDIRENPYFEKYANQISELQKVPKEFKTSLEKNLDNIQPVPALHKERVAAKESNYEKDVKLSHFQKQKDLNQIMKLEAVQEKNAAEIEAIWKQYHQVKDGVYAVLPGDSYQRMHSNLKQYPVFLFPMPRAQGYEFVMCQYIDQSCYFTSLVNYQAFKENAPVCLTVTYFTEFLKSKDIVLMRGEYDKNALKAAEAQCLTNQLQLYYGNKDVKKLQLIEQFNKYPSTFKHMDLIANFEYSLGN